MGKTLKSNVLVGDRWYGPDYPDAKVTDDVFAAIDNPAVFDPPDVSGNPDRKVPNEAPPASDAAPAAEPTAASGSEDEAKVLKRLGRDELEAMARESGAAEDAVSGAKNKGELVDLILAARSAPPASDAAPAAEPTAASGDATTTDGGNIGSDDGATVND